MVNVIYLFDFIGLCSFLKLAWILLLCDGVGTRPRTANNDKVCETEASIESKAFIESKA